jgi:hypothetical protein
MQDAGTDDRVGEDETFAGATGCIIRAKTNSGSGPIRTPFRFIPNKLPAESERGQ